MTTPIEALPPAPPATDAKRADGMPANAIERTLRRMLCASYAGSAAYMDDGEASDSRRQPHIDFMRFTPDQIRGAMYARGSAEIADATQLAPSGEWVTVPMEPTQAMRDAGYNGPILAYDHTAYVSAAAVYRAMIAAAPKLPEPQAEKAEPQHPTLEQCEAAGRGPENGPGAPYNSGGLPDTPEERERFKAYMRGHCWDVGSFDSETRAFDTVHVRCLYGVWRGRGALAAPQAEKAEPARPDLLERLSYHARERDDMTIDELLSVLGPDGYKKVHGRTARQLELQLLALLAAAPQAAATPEGWQLVPKADGLWFDGEIAEVAVWSSALAQANFDSLAAGALPESIASGSLIDSWSLLT